MKIVLFGELVLRMEICRPIGCKLTAVAEALKTTQD